MTGRIRTPSTTRAADSRQTTIRSASGVSSARRRRPVRSRRVTAPVAFTSTAAVSPTTKSTSEPSTVRQNVSGRPSREYESQALSSQKISCSSAVPNAGLPASTRVMPASRLATPTSKKYSLAREAGLRRGRRGVNGCSSVASRVSCSTWKYSRTVRAGTAASEASRSNTIGCPRLTAAAVRNRENGSMPRTSPSAWTSNCR